jgi:hypothetical protein
MSPLWGVRSWLHLQSHRTLWFKCFHYCLFCPQPESNSNWSYYQQPLLVARSHSRRQPCHFISWDCICFHHRSNRQRYWASWDIAHHLSEASSISASPPQCHQLHQNLLPQCLKLRKLAAHLTWHFFLVRPRATPAPAWAAPQATWLCFHSTPCVPLTEPPSHSVPRTDVWVHESACL